MHDGVPQKMFPKKIKGSFQTGHQVWLQKGCEAKEQTNHKAV